MSLAFLRRAVLLAVFLMPFLASAQGTMDDVVYLKNGSVIRGVIVEQVPNQSLKIRTGDGNLFVFRIEEVEKITKEEAVGKAAPKERGERQPRSGFTDAEMKERGYSATAELVTALGYNNFGDKSSFGLQVINGYQVNPYFTAGVGVGLNQHFSGAAFMPVFLDLRGTFLRKRVSPFFDLAGGWAVPLNTTEHPDDGGVYFTPAFGVRFFVSRSTSLNLSVGMRYQEGTWTEEYWDYYNGNVLATRTERTHRNAFTLRFGVTF